MTRVSQYLRAWLLCLIAVVGSRFPLAAQQQPASEGDTAAASDPTTIFDHPAHTRWWISGQLNTIYQAHPDFHALYSGPNSLRPEGEAKDSRVFTLYTGLAVTKYTEVFFDLESSGGRGIGDALGLAGYTNLDVVRNPDLGATPYVARVMLRQIVPLSHETVEAERNPFALATTLPVRRIEIRAGKFSAPDFFDVNAVGSDSHLQFMNWAIDNNAAYDYAADTRGYTYGVILEFQDRHFGARFGELLMPKVANGLNLDWRLPRARAENFELELRPTLAGRHTVLRLLSYANHANMGDYRQAVELYLSERTVVPDIIATRQQGRTKYGFGVNLEQPITNLVRSYARFGWNEGRHESFVYTEVNQSISFGGDMRGRPWGRKMDKVGVAFATNGISRDHQHYLALGGLGFLLGDGGLTYGREDIAETYYTAHVWRGIFASIDFQHITNPGYNRVRGPVWVPALRLHLEL